MDRDRPLSIAIMALGGQGGGVLTGWLVETAEANGHIAQSTYVAGVAQRTGATVYCVEMFPRARAEAAGRQPVFTPYPIPGDVDLVIAGEMAETGRAIEKGFVTPNATTLIASSHRVYSMSEKEALGDGIMDMAHLRQVAGEVSRRFACFDMQKAADETGSVISSVMFGAIAASGALPFGRDAFEDTIRQTGKAVDANLRGFAAGYDGFDSGPEPAVSAITTRPEPRGRNGAALAARIERELPEPVHDMALHGALRTLDYQDLRYANQYLDSLAAFVEVDDAARGFALTMEVARQLALQMSYEDTIRVADLKTRRERFDRIGAQIGAESEQPFHVREYFHPRLEELCDTLPAFLGSRIVGSPTLRRVLSPLFRKGRIITTTSIIGYLFLRALAAGKRLRRTTYRYQKQMALIDDWLDRVTAAAGDDYEYGLAVARCVEIVRGYGDTYERGLRRYLATMDAGPAAKNATAVRRLYEAALADEQGKAFRDALNELQASA